MSAIEISELAQYEQVIERGLQTFYDVGSSLIAIRDKRLYRNEYKSFEEYCLERWNISRDSAYNYIKATQAFNNIKDGADSVEHAQHPASIRQLLPLAKLRREEVAEDGTKTIVFDEDAQREAWQRAIETAPDGNVTGAHVQRVVDEMLGIQREEPAQQVDTETGEIFDPDEIPFNYKRDVKAQRAATPYVPQGNDACQTPPYAIDPLLPYLNVGITIWEPAAGEMHLVEAFYDAGFKTVVTSDMITGQNFLEYEPVEHWDCIVTNPPFTLKYEFIERCYELGKPFALLVPVEVLGAGKAQSLMKANGFEIMLLSRRIDFKMPNAGWSGAGSQFPTLWLCWQLLPQPVVFGDIPIEAKRAWHDAQ